VGKDKLGIDITLEDDEDAIGLKLRIVYMESAANLLHRRFRNEGLVQESMHINYKIGAC